MDKIEAPFSKDLVKKLNDRQKDNTMHPYTCGGDNIPECKRSLAYKLRFEGNNIPFTDENEGVLIATRDGWICPCGKYKQNWCI